MRKRILLLAALSVFSASMPAFAMEHPEQGMTDEQCQRECEMLVKSCAREADTIQQKIGKLEAKVKKGASAYTRDELRRLEQQLQDAKETLLKLQTK